MNSIQALESFFSANPFVFIVIVVWSLFWKALAMWKSARLSHKWWFAVLLVINTFGVLEILYLMFVARNYSVSVEEK